MTDFNPSLPYNDLPDLPPPVEQIESTAILKRCIDARVAVAELKQAAELIPNAAGLVNALPRLEARYDHRQTLLIRGHRRGPSGCRDQGGFTLSYGAVRRHQDGPTRHAHHRYGHTDMQHNQRDGAGYSS